MHGLFTMTKATVFPLVLVLLVALLGMGVDAYSIANAVNNVTDCDVTPCAGNGGSCTVGDFATCQSTTTDKNSLCVRLDPTYAGSVWRWDNPRVTHTSTLLNGTGQTSIIVGSCNGMHCQTMEVSWSRWGRENQVES